MFGGRGVYQLRGMIHEKHVESGWILYFHRAILVNVNFCEGMEWFKKIYGPNHLSFSNTFYLSILEKSLFFSWYRQACIKIRVGSSFSDFISRFQGMGDGIPHPIHQSDWRADWKRGVVGWSQEWTGMYHCTSFLYISRPLFEVAF